jgi:multidrug efflux system membrane fusion protein
MDRSGTGVKTAATGVDAAKAAVARARSTVTNAQAQLTLATNNVHRIEPLLQKQYVTVEQVDQVHTAMQVAQGNYDEAQAALTAAEAQLNQAVLRQQDADTGVSESQARLGQAVHTVDTVDTLMSQRPGRDARVLSARLDLERCRVVAPFDAWVTNLNISEGAYARAGVAMFTLIDTRTWYVIANYRESNLRNIRNGMHVDVYLMGHPDRMFNGVVESTGYGVFPEDGRVAGGLPDIQRTLNWVHLSARFPVRVRVRDPDPALFRIGATAVTVIK